MSRTAAFFDIDGTITRDGLIIEMFKKMITYELIDKKKFYNEVEADFNRWDRRLGDYDTYLQKMVDIYSEAVVGINSFLVDHIAKKVVEQNGDRVYTYSRERIKWHRERGDMVIAVSGSPLELVREMSRKYEMDDYRGTVYCVDEKGLYNGQIIPMWDSRSKMVAITEFAELYDIDLSKSFAYGDTNGDFTMFSLVGNPFAINPTRELLTRILEDEQMHKKISVIVERKNVTYRMDPDKIELV